MDIKEKVTAWVKSIKPGDATVEIPVAEFKEFLGLMAAMRTDHISQVDLLGARLQSMQIQVEAMRLVLAPLSVKADVSEEKLLSLLDEAVQGAKKAVLQ